MQLRSLTLQALGPFAGRYTIDFEQLGASGLYLLEGPTGAGKSTILDAIVFALYGKVASAAASDDRLRSGYADEDTETFVDLVFETGSGAYRVWRSPEWQRAKKRGAGTTKQQASVKLWRLGAPDGAGGVATELDPDAGELISARLDEAGAEIQRAIGLDRSQFVQTIVLPQGEFASFLRADPERRRGLLQKVFGTGVYEQVQEQLAVMRADAQRAVVAALGGLGSATAHFVGAAGITERPDDEALAGATELRVLADTAAPDLLPAVRAHTRSLAAAAARASAADEGARAAVVVARAALEDARTLADAIARRDALRAEHRGFLDRTQADAGDRRLRDLARRAAVLASVLAAADAASRQASAARRLLATARKRVSADLAAVDRVDLDRADLDRAGLMAARDAFAAEVATLRRLEQLERDLPDHRTRLVSDESALTASLAEQQALAADDAARPALRDLLTRAVEAEREVAVDLPVRRQREQWARAALVAAQAARDLELELIDALAAAGDSLAAAQTAIADEAYLRGRRLAGIAGELAAALVPGEQCPVCGAVEHPNIATLGADHATADQVAAAEGARVLAEQASASASGTAAILTERLAGQRELAGPRTVAEHDAAVAGAVGLVRAAVAAQSNLADLRVRLAEHDDRAVAIALRHQDLVTVIATARASIGSRRAELTGHEREIDDSRGGAPTVAARVAVLSGQLAACTTLAESLEAVERAEDDHVTRAGELGKGLAEQGFVDATDARAALLPAAELARLETAVVAHATGLARVASALAEPSLAGLADAVVVDLEGARAACDLAEGAASTAGRASALAASVASSSATARGAVEAAYVGHRAARELAAPVTRMADLAAASGGDNAMRLTLATYVLVKRFEDVVAAANERLLAMSDGRFELLRSDEREDVRGRRMGLAMKIVDHRMEAARDPRTLSGGETFYVSLCLALGMADVVTAEAGGIELGTLFVDEGFGSLDPETLEAVLAVLARLRTGGRVVGVVSHVEALKQSIAERIEVRRLPDGSSTLTVRAG